ncbi:rhamnogalacturonan acetylesterase [Echinicola strongylocentroti]|uniref:Rhamnogalacturonan acetylesterase n=1 Tax=Echinicola strongylocentroti TaxID=1795355 RepID=A0A2Z4IR98_9BACT|nr:rhamnogalacturonan acetylesterase [Echinicola strongylocentroti]AWW33188.1 rhamnogalacturonan acetylesterase [Echinicola strongylocentroti]
MKNVKYGLTAVMLLMTLLLAFTPKEEKHTLYIIGDSTVRNSRGDGGPGQWGWGTFIDDFFDSTKLEVSNQAMAGRSTRTFVKEGRWQRVLDDLKPGDFVMMQFGHNEGSKPDTTRAGYRGVLRGTGDETVELTWPDGTEETVHTYGWYLKKFVTEAKKKGATPIICSMIPRNKFQDGEVERANQDYGKWAKEIARKTGAYFVDLNSIVADQYDEWGANVVPSLFEKDHTHTNEAGARINAWSAVQGIKSLEDCKLKAYLSKDKPTLYLIGDSTVKNGQGDGAGGLWGWGDYMAPFFDLDKIKVQNHALGGTSSRTYQTYGLWENVRKQLEPGDYVIMQFGHNDSSPLDDSHRARGTIRSAGTEAEEIYNPITEQYETVYSYGQYLKQMITATKAAGATPIVCSLIPRNNWKEGKVNRANDSYGLWAKQAAETRETYFIDLNNIIADGYDALGEDHVKAHFFNDTDHTHTILEGAKYNAKAVVKGIQGLENCDLKGYLLED